MSALQLRQIDRAVVTGPTGAVGSALCRRLLAEGASVWAVVRPHCRRLNALPKHEKLHIVECDVSEMTSLPEKMASVSVDALFHLAWAGTTGAGRNDMPAQIDNIRYTIMRFTRHLPWARPCLSVRAVRLSMAAQKER